MRIECPRPCWISPCPLPTNLDESRANTRISWKKCTEGPSTCHRDSKTPSNRKTRYLNYTKPVTRGHSVVLTPVLVYVAAEAEWDPRGPHMSYCPRHLSFPFLFFLFFFYFSLQRFPTPLLRSLRSSACHCPSLRGMPPQPQPRTATSANARR
ncbi:hypothetical protein EE612_057681 [Oryza sativa]|nr:hypothetical protein EE612_057681 [Oryza sativa]